MDAASGINQHKAMASGGTTMDGNFGCKELGSSKGPSMGGDMNKTRGDSDRGAPGPVKHSSGKLKSQAQVDHGKH